MTWLCYCWHCMWNTEVFNMPSLGWWTCCLAWHSGVNWPVVLGTLVCSISATCPAVTKPVWIITLPWLFTGHVGIIQLCWFWISNVVDNPLLWCIYLLIFLFQGLHTQLLWCTFSVWNGFCLMASLGDAHSRGTSAHKHCSDHNVV